MRSGVRISPPGRTSFGGAAGSTTMQGMVIVEATIDTAGRLQNARVLRSDSPIFVEAALSAVRQWTCTPTLLNGVPANVLMTVTVPFRMN